EAVRSSGHGWGYPPIEETRMNRPITALIACFSLLPQAAGAQSPPIEPERPRAPMVVRPYEAATTPGIRMSNSQRLHQLIRAGKVYLTVQDALALAVENNLDLEVNRYGPILAQWRLERAEAGGPLRGVTSGSSQIG